MSYMWLTSGLQTTQSVVKQWLKQIFVIPIKKKNLKYELYVAYIRIANKPVLTFTEFRNSTNSYRNASLKRVINTNRLKRVISSMAKKNTCSSGAASRRLQLIVTIMPSSSIASIIALNIHRSV